MQNRIPLLQQRLEAMGIPERTFDGIDPNLATPRFASMAGARATSAWDPHEVWLERIHKPREQRRGT